MIGEASGMNPALHGYRVIEELQSGYRHIKQGWIQGTFSRNSRGEDLPISDPTSVSFCLVGALIHEYPIGNICTSDCFTYILRAVNDLFPDESCAPMDLIGQGEGGSITLGMKKLWIVEFNDTEARQQQDVEAVLLRAIELVQEDYQLIALPVLINLPVVEEKVLVMV